MADEGSELLMRELILEETEVKAKLAALEAQMVAPAARLAKAREIVLKAKGAYEHCLAEMKPLESDKILLEGELQALAEKKSAVRVEARKIAAGGIRPGTQQFVEELERMAGDRGEAEARQAAKDLAVDDLLAAMKAKAGES